MTALHADTIFGHLCWVIIREKGDIGLKKVLDSFIKGSPPFIISDGYPTGYLPKPLSVEFSLEEPARKKDAKKIDFVSVDDFKAILEGDTPELKKTEGLVRNVLTAHNTISRETHTTPSSGGLYSVEESYIDNITVYCKAESDEWQNMLVGLFEKLSLSGYGKRKSIGKGQFIVQDVSGVDIFDGIGDADGFVSLSEFCPDVDDPIEGIYRTFVKYGKLGEEFTFCGNPFKRPLLMFKAGSVFKTNGFPKPFYGRMVEGVSPAKPEVVQYAYAFAVPIKIPNLFPSAGQ